jgi:hypothetical protein
MGSPETSEYSTSPTQPKHGMSARHRAAMTTQKVTVIFDSLRFIASPVFDNRFVELADDHRWSVTFAIIAAVGRRRYSSLTPKSLDRGEHLLRLRQQWRLPR